MFEVFGTLEKPDDCFVGARFARFTERQLTEMRAYVDATLGSRFCFAPAIARLGDIAGGELLRGGPDFLELGMFNNWISFGPVKFWRRGDAPAVREAFGRALGENPRYLDPARAPIVLEIAYTIPLQHWAGFSISKRLPDGNYVLDADLAERLIGSACL